MSTLSSPTISVLFVDDDPDIAMCMAMLAQEALGYTAEYATWTPTAATRARHFDLVVSDLEMPCGGARHLLQGGVETPVAVVSSRFPNAQLEAEMIGLGAVLCRAKDTSPEWLNQLLLDAAVACER